MSSNYTPPSNMVLVPCQRCKQRPPEVFVENFRGEFMFLCNECVTELQQLAERFNR